MILIKTVGYSSFKQCSSSETVVVAATYLWLQQSDCQATHRRKQRCMFVGFERGSTNQNYPSFIVNKP